MIRTEVVDRIQTITIDRPERKNALTMEMFGQIADALEAAAASDVRAVLLRGHGGNFTSGSDVANFKGALSRDSAGTRMIRLLARFEKPLVAQVEGHAIGVGATMLLLCDFVYASETARIQFPFVNLGLVPEAGSSLLLPARVGHAVASELFLLGETIGADKALALRLVNAVIPSAELEGHVGRALARLRAQPPEAVRQTKRLLRSGQGLAERIEAEMDEFSRRMAGPEVAEAIAAFFEKRAPKFS
jgi:enoyl-CoA hydratase/carnithine racemase